MIGDELELRFIPASAHLSLHTFQPAAHGLGFT
jgi:hypothetical protein